MAKTIIRPQFFIVILLVLLAFRLGTLAVHREAKKGSASGKAESFSALDTVLTHIPDKYKETDVRSLISISNPEDVQRKRQELIQFVLGVTDLTSVSADLKVEQNIKDPHFSTTAGLSSIDRLTVTMPHGINSVAYLLRPLEANGRLLIYHQGHQGCFTLGEPSIGRFLEQGFVVLAFSMPLFGYNNQPVVHLERFGRVKLDQHEYLKYLDRPIQYFAMPVIVALNYLTVDRQFKDVSMVGISGGGWTTHLIAALDPRIQQSYPVAGSTPIYLRFNAFQYRDYGDFEETYRDLYEVANYLEWYILGSAGAGRSQVQVINQFDPCCHGGLKHRTYEPIIKEIVAGLNGGEFQILLDEQHREHSISEVSLTEIIKRLG